MTALVFFLVAAFCATLLLQEGMHRAERRGYTRFLPPKQVRTRHISPHRKALERRRKDEA